MPPRRYRARRRLGALVALALLFVVASLLAGVVYAAHRDPAYRRSVDASFAAEASVLVASSNGTGAELASTILDAGHLGRLVLASRLEALEQQAVEDEAASAGLLTPPPDADAAPRLVDVLRLRERGIATVNRALFGVLGLTPTSAVGSTRRPPPPWPHVQLPGARHLLRIAGQEFVLADRDYRALTVAFARAGRGAALPASRWVTAASKTLLPQELLVAGPAIAHSPALQPTVHLVLAAVETTPPELPLGRGYPVTPTGRFSVAISVRNVGNAPTVVNVTITAQPLGTSRGHSAYGTARAVVGADEAVALELPAIDVVPGEHCLVTVQIQRPARQPPGGGLRWRRVVVVASTRS